MTDVAPVVDAVAGTTRPFEALMAVEGRWTGDDRLIMVDALSWEGLLPIPLTDGHYADTEDIAGWITEIERVPGMSPDERFIIGRGVFNLGTDAAPNDAGSKAVAQLEAGTPLGVSVDLDDISQGGIDPTTITEEEDLWSMVVESARIRALALCVIAAFAESLITLGTVDTKTPVPSIDGPTPVAQADMPEIEIVSQDVIVVASGHTITIPSCPPAEWFSEPLDVDIEGALTVTDEGRIYGLLAPANVPHVGMAGRVVVPMGNVDYSRFTRGETPVEGGGRIVTGNLTMECGHGDTLSTQAQPVVEHYDNTCSLVATLAVGERSAKPRGVWVAGALLPGVTADQVRRMMACQLSGHWVPTRDGYELLAALLVPVPGFGMARSRPSVTLKDGALAASAVPVRFENDCGCGGGTALELDGIRMDIALMRSALDRAVEMLTSPPASTNLPIEPASPPPTPFRPPVATRSRS